MPGTTPNRSYPYPLGTDPLRPARDIQLLAEAVDADYAVFVTTADVASALAGYVRIAGSTMTGQLNGIAPTAAANLTRKDYVDAAVGARVLRSGDTMSGTLTVPNVLHSAAQSSLAYASTRKDYVDGQTALRVAKSGDTMTGTLTINPTSGDLGIRLRGGSPLMEFYNEAATTRYGYIQGLTTALTFVSGTAIRLHAVGDIILEPDAAVAGFISRSVFVWGKSASDLANMGVEMFGIGSAAEGSIRNTIGSASIQNWYARHQGASDADNVAFATFVRSTGSTIGAIRQNALTGVTFETTSDSRTKNVLGPITGALDRLLALEPKRVTWIDDPDRGESDALIADHVYGIVPGATSGTPGAVYDEAEAEANGVAPGDPKMMGLDYSMLVPLLIGAVQELTAIVRGD